MPHPSPAEPPTSSPAAATPPATFGSKVQKRVAALVGNPFFWLLGVGLIFLVPLGRTMALEIPDAPPLKMQLPPFAFTDEKNQPFTLETMRGKIWVADFIFTSCPVVCPKLTHRMEEIQDRAKNVGDAFHLVSFTVDPENDTPERLAAFAKGYHTNERRWSFVTGPLDQIEETVVKGFKLSMGKEESTPGLFSIFHAERFVLVDDEGSIRGYFDATDEGVDDLLHNVKLLVNLR